MASEREFDGLGPGARPERARDRRSSADRARRAIAIALTVVSVTAALPASAEPSAAEKETARALMGEGRDRRKANDHPGALEAFLGAHRIMGVPTTGLEVGREQIALGQLVEARDTLLSVLRIAPQSNEPKAFVEARAEAERLALDLAPRIPSLRFRFAHPIPASATVTIDAVTISHAALQTPFKVNPGEHLIVVRQGPWSREEKVRVAEGETREVAFGNPAHVEPPAVASTAARGPIATTPPVVGAASERRTSPLVYAGFGLAGAGIVVGSVTGALSWSRVRSTRDRCDGNLCGPETYGDLDAARGLGNVSTIAFAAAGVFAVVGIIGLATSGAPSAEPASARSNVRSTDVFFTGTGFALRGSF
jgi:hypothetical protein